MAYRMSAAQLEEIWGMPETSHYPDRSLKFSFERSDVIKFLRATLDVTLPDAIKAFQNLRRDKAILYDPVKKCWMGRNLMVPK